MDTGTLTTAGLSYEDAFRLLIDRSPTPFWINSENRIVYINRAGLALLRAERPDQVLGRSPFEFIHPQYHADVAERVRRLRSGEQPDVGVLDEEFIRLDGTLVPVSVSAAALPYDGGNAVQVHFVDMTDCRTADERFRATFEQAAVGIAHVGVKGEWLRVNARLCEIVGYPHDELVRLTFRDITHPDDVRADWEQAEALMRGEMATYSMEKRYIGRNGEVVWTNLTVSLMRDRSGAPDYFISVIEDIRARKQAEQALRDSEARFRTLFENSPVGKYLIDPETQTVVAANERAAAQLGLTREQLAGMHVTEFDRGFSKTDLRAMVRKQFQGTIQFETRHRSAGGEIRDVFITTECVVLDGRALHYASALDITERKQAEQASRELAATLEQRVQERTHELEQQSVFLKTVLDTIDVGIISCDSTGKIQLMNRSALQSHAERRHNSVTDPWSDKYDIFEADAKTPLTADRLPLARALRGERLTEEAVVIGPTGGPHRTFLANGRPLVDGAGCKLGAVVAMHDVTEQKAAERERTEAIKRLAEANQELEAFAYSVSHDLRGPLRSIAGFGNILLRDYTAKLDDNGAGAIRRMVAATHRMGQLIDDLLMLSRVSRQELIRSQVDLSSMAESIFAELFAQQPDRRITVKVQPGMRAFADARLSRILLENLLSNAWKFTIKCDDPYIDFVCQEREHANIFVIRDNGAGFDMAFSDKLFRPFQRLHQAHEFEGTGIGLATVRRIATRHAGRVWAEASPGNGAAFYFSLEPGDSGR